MPHASAHRLTPPEKWFSLYILRRQQTHRTGAIIRLEQNYGPDGMILFASTLLWGTCVGIVGVLGLITLFASDGKSALTYVFLGLGLLFLGPTLFRSRQTANAGKTFRGDRPFLRR